jgi:hypothetical protein
MTLDGVQATAAPPSADINRRLPISIATRTTLNWDHYRCIAEKNIMPELQGFASCVSYGKVTTLGHRNIMPTVQYTEVAPDRLKNFGKTRRAAFRQ